MHNSAPHYNNLSKQRTKFVFASFVFLVNISAEDEKRLFNGTVDWIVSCQTYEGGIGGVPDKEAHGGYTFCGIAALALLGSTGKCNLQKLLVRFKISVLPFRKNVPPNRQKYLTFFYNRDGR